MANKALTALRLADRDAFEEARNLLTNNLRPRVNGFADAGAPEGGYWIIDCSAQNAVYDAITDLINSPELVVNGG